MKRLFDVLFSALVFSIGFPVFVVLVFIATIRFGNPFFSQERIGWKSNPFLIFKIKTLGLNHQLTPFWAMVRTSGLDEFPQLWNILKGDMSWVGPRPLLPEYLQHYTPREASRHQVKPGIFGLSQKEQMGRKLSWKERLEFDAVYVEKHNFLFDIQIMFTSIIILISAGRKNASDFERFRS